MIPTTCDRCGAPYLTARPTLSRWCSQRCRGYAFRQRRDARRLEVLRSDLFELLVQHGDAIRTAAAEGLDPDRGLLDDLARRMDALADVFAAAR